MPRAFPLRVILAVGGAVLLTACSPKVPDLAPGTRARIEDRTGHPPRPGEQQPDGQLPPSANLTDGVTEDEAAAVALWNNAQLAADLSGLGIARANLIDAASFKNPTLQMLFPIGPKPFELTLLLPLEQLWQRPKRIKAAKAAFEQVAEALVQNGLDTARDARQAHAALVQAQERDRVGREVAELGRQLARMAEARLRAGDISATEAKMAATTAAVTDEGSRRFQHDVTIARETLRGLLGLPPGTELRAVAGDIVQAPVPPADQLRELAWSQRPDLRALEVGVAAAGARAGWERSRLIALGVVLSTKEVGSSGVRSGPGLSLDIPIFRSNAGAVSRADAEVEQAALQYLARRQRVDLEVSTARARLVQALDSLADWHERVVRALQDVAERSRQAYLAGDVSYLTVLEASRQWIDATLRDIDLQTAARQAAAELDRSVGTRVVRGTQP